MMRACLSVSPASAIRWNDGSEFTTIVEHARGSLERPLSDAELEKKLLKLASHGCPDLNVKPLADAIWSIESVSDVRQITRLAVPEPGR